MAIEDTIEDAAFHLSPNDTERALFSIAISLKRIADALSNNAAGEYNLYDMVERMVHK
jgi:hypothetical protein